MSVAIRIHADDHAVCSSTFPVLVSIQHHVQPMAEIIRNSAVFLIFKSEKIFQ